MQDRYFMPSRENGNLMDVAVAIFDKQLLGQEIKRTMFVDSFVAELGIVNMKGFR